MRVEDLDEAGRDQFMEALQEGFDLQLDGFSHLVVGNLLHVVQLVLFCHQYIASVLDDFDGLVLAEIVCLVAESQLTASGRGNCHYASQSRAASCKAAPPLSADLRAGEGLEAMEEECEERGVYL